MPRSTRYPSSCSGMAGGEQVTLPPLKYTVRLSYADGQGELPLGRYAYEKLGYRKMVLMGPDYAGSTGKLWAFHQGFEKAGGKIVQTILWPLGTMDLAPYFAQLKPGCDAIFPFIPGDISINRFLSQYFELGLDKKGIQIVHPLYYDRGLSAGEDFWGKNARDYQCRHVLPRL